MPATQKEQLDAILNDLDDLRADVENASDGSLPKEFVDNITDAIAELSGDEEEEESAEDEK